LAYGPWLRNLVYGFWIKVIIEEDNLGRFKERAEKENLGGGLRIGLSSVPEKLMFSLE
jgi:hypothetical protein